LLLLAEMFGRRRAVLMGLLVGAAFLTRAPLAFAGPALALWMVPSWSALVDLLPAVLFFLWYNLDRFGSATESGYALASLPPWLEAQRQLGLFALAHVGMNVDYLFFHLPTFTNTFPY